METRYFNKEVTINALYFRGQTKRRFKAFPKRMVYEGREITFIESGLQFLIKKGQTAVKLFDMTDGQTDYRLQLDPEGSTWKLLRATPANGAEEGR
jgi:hypothetical protein